MAEKSAVAESANIGYAPGSFVANVVIEVAELTPQDRNDLKSAGWTILAAEAEKLLEDLASAGVK